MLNGHDTEQYFTQQTRWAGAELRHFAWAQHGPGEVYSSPVSRPRQGSELAPELEVTGTVLQLYFNLLSLSERNHTVLGVNYR